MTDNRYTQKSSITPNTHSTQNQKKPKDDSDLAVYALVASVGGLLTGFTLIGGILGLIFVRKAYDKGEDSDMLLVSRIISIIDIVLGIIGIFLIIFIFGSIGFGFLTFD